LNVEIFQIVSSDHMAAEGEFVAETSVNHIADSLPVPVPPKKKKMTGKSAKCWRRCYQPEMDWRFRFKP
jgi:hypothetical protein